MENKEMDIVDMGNMLAASIETCHWWLGEDGDQVCTNDKSVYLADWTGPEDWCDAWENGGSGHEQ